MFLTQSAASLLRPLSVVALPPSSFLLLLVRCAHSPELSDSSCLQPRIRIESIESASPVSSCEVDGREVLAASLRAHSSDWSPSGDKMTLLGSLILHGLLCMRRGSASLLLVFVKELGPLGFGFLRGLSLHFELLSRVVCRDSRSEP